MTVRAKLATIFLTLIIFPAVLAGVLLFSYIRDVVKEVRVHQLESVAGQEAKKVDAFFAERRGDALLFQTYPIIKDNLPVFIRLAHDRQSPAYIMAKQQLEDRLKTLVRVYGYSDVMLAGPDGRVVAVGNEAHISEQLGKPLSLLDKKAFDAGRKGVYFSDIYMSALDRRYAMLCTAPLLDNRGGFMGEVAFEIDAGRLFEEIKDATGLGETGETFLGIMRAGDVLFINPFHPERDEARKKAAFWGGKTALPMQKALKGESGVGESVDYLGHGVFAAWRQVPSTGWGLVAKIDSSEALATVTKARWLALGLVLFILLTCGTAALLISKSITGPIRDLQLGAEIIGSGDLDYKVGTKASDEVGQLSRAIDRMA
jgi:HAMP domain-containing protein